MSRTRACGETIRDSIKSVVTQRTLQQVVTAERTEFTDAMMKTARPFAEQLGVELVDVRITKIDLPQQVQDSVFERMRATFKAQAAKLRAEGVEASDRIHAEANKEQTEILADASRRASQTRGAGRRRGERGVCQVVLEECGVLQLLSQHALVSRCGRHAGRSAGDCAGQCVLQVLQQAATAASALGATGMAIDVGWAELGRYLGGAFALYLVLEGILPFLNPGAAKRLMAKLAQTEPKQLRWGGLISMVLGLALLWMARNG